MLDKILPLYALLLEKLIEMGIREIQIHEPSLVTSTASSRLVSLLPMVYGLNKKKGALEKRNLSIDLVTYFEEIDHQVYEWFLESNISALSLDFTRGNNLSVLEKYGFPQGKRLGAGLIDGRNIWKLNPTKILNDVESIKRILSGSSSSSRNDIFMTIQPSCSLQHVPFTKESEFGLIKDDSSCRGLFGVLSFACEKLQEIQLVTKVALESETLSNLFKDTKNAWELFYQHNPSKPQVQSRLHEISEADLKRPSVFSERRPLQLKGLPILPTTTIGSFPQTPQLRTLRRQLKKGDISVQSYEARINEQIAFNIGIQEALGLDILVHGEPERTDMVEYFAEKIEGFAFTSNAWVQSYGSRCVRPPIIYADLERPHPMTVREFQVAQSFTSKPVKGMLTGPVTILNWSFPRLDISRQEQAFQLALCLREEVADLENAQCQVIQVDEPALREGMPLKKENKDTYLKWAVDAFRLSTAVAKDTTSIHTHMCYCEFGDCLAAIDALDADVNSIENARSDDETIRDFKSIHYERDLGPGTYDIHSPVVPSKQQIVHKLESFLKLLPAKQVVVNPDCGLKTRQWPETIAALRNMVNATLQVRQQLKVCT
jgi:5-methyltetrahydropteroyltriglutamate--homocysteine methyltransferase